MAAESLPLASVHWGTTVSSSTQVRVSGCASATNLIVFVNNQRGSHAVVSNATRMGNGSRRASTVINMAVPPSSLVASMVVDCSGSHDPLWTLAIVRQSTTVLVSNVVVSPFLADQRGSITATYWATRA